jgi:beta-phosphoglucomutase-like phosphatase (HAD superfamily)
MYFNEEGWPTQIAESDRKQFIQDLHNLKTENFNKVVQSGACKLRPGVMRLMDDALSKGLFVAVCSTSNDAAVRTIVRTLLGERLNRIKIFAGDIVEKKKPAPDVYLLAAKVTEPTNSSN